MKKEEIKKRAQKVVQVLEGLSMAEARKVMREAQYLLYEVSRVTSQKEARKSHEDSLQS